MTTKKLAFVGDIGGTNARFALVEDGVLVPGSTYNCATKDYTNPTDAIKSFLAAKGNPEVTSACLALACGITGDTLKLTNCHWEFSKKHIQEALDIRDLLFVNDFTALAMGVPTLAPEQYYAIGGGIAEPEKPIGVAGPGTGFGVSGLIWSGGHWVPLQGEGGHVDFAPADALEMEILRLGWREYNGRVSVERILTGDGLEFLYRTLCQIKQIPVVKKKAADITKEALSDSKSLSREVVNIFCGVLGSAIGNLALTLGAFGGIYIGGGITAKLGDMVHASPLRPRFEAKARFEQYISRIPTYVIADSVQTALLGAAAILNDRK